MSRGAALAEGNVVTKAIIFTDLDGTLLEAKTYSFREAAPALELIREAGVPLVLCSSKTRAELELCQHRLGIAGPFIAENGGAVFAPAGYFRSPAGSVRSGRYFVSAFGTPYREVRQAFVQLRERLAAAVKGFGDMTAEEISEVTGLPEAEAILAKERDFTEPFLFDGAPDERFLAAIESAGLHWTQGRLFTLMGDHDKGRAVRLLQRWYESEQGRLITIGVGDSLNDLPLLREVDHPVLVRNADGEHDRRIDLPGMIRTEGIGPSGWNSAVLELLRR